VLVLEWSVCGTVRGAYVNELKRARNAKERSDLCLCHRRKVGYIYADARMGVLNSVNKLMRRDLMFKDAFIYPSRQLKLMYFVFELFFARKVSRSSENSYIKRQNYAQRAGNRHPLHFP